VDLTIKKKKKKQLEDSLRLFRWKGEVGEASFLEKTGYASLTSDRPVEPKDFSVVPRKRKQKDSWEVEPAEQPGRLSPWVLLETPK